MIPGRLIFSVLSVAKLLLPMRSGFGGTNHLMPSLPKKVGQEIGIGAIVKIQVEGHGRRLPA
jgi:hypothetical protein